MKINRICALFIATVTALNCTTLVFAEENQYNLLSPEYRIEEEIELEPKSLYSFEAYSSPYMDIEYSYNPKVTVGTVRYISQMTSSKYFNSGYWGRWDGNTSIRCANGSWYGGPDQECFTSCISMSLSYIGVNKTPADILEFGGGVTIVNTEWGGAAYSNPSFAAAVDNFINGNGTYSPPIIHLNNYSYAGHYVIVIGKSSDNVYRVLDPARDTVWDLTINGSTATYTNENGSTRRDTVTSAHQYYKATASIIRPFLCNIESPVSAEKYTNEVKVSGWAIYGKGITKVTGIINGKSFDIPLMARLDVAAAHPGYPTGKEGFSATIPVNYLKNGTNKLELHAFYNTEDFHIGTVSFTYDNPTLPEISNVEVTQDVEGYTITCNVADDYEIDRVQFPTWTVANGQDDLDKEWATSDFSKGKIDDGKVTYRVNRSDHNNETGLYITDIYAYDVHGNYVTYSVEHTFESTAPIVNSLSVSKTDTGYTVYCTAADESGVSYVEYETYKLMNDSSELIASGKMENPLITEDNKESFFTCTNEIEDNGYYRTNVSVFDIYGNCKKDSVVICLDNEKQTLDPVVTKSFNGHTYVLFDLGEMTLEEASLYCNSIGASLAEGNTDEEAAFIQEMTAGYEAPSFICEFAPEGLCGEQLSYSISSDNVLTINGSGAMYDWTVNEPAPWDYYREKIKKVVISDSVTCIGDRAFAGFLNLYEVEIPSSVTKIGNSAFEEACSLAEIIIPKNVLSVGENAFNRCFALEKVTVMGKETVINSSAFTGGVTFVGYSNTPAENYAEENLLEFISLSGDLDNDGRPTAKDALIILKHAGSVEVITDEMKLEAADLNNDKRVNAEDALYVLKWAAGIIK